MTIHTSRDGGRPDEAAAVHVEHLVDDGGERVAAAHAQSWQARWQAADVAVEGDPEAQRALRFATYHLIGAANPEDVCVGRGAGAHRGRLQRPRVLGHRDLPAALLYLHVARSRAGAAAVPPPHPAGGAREGRRLGYAGALFAWESADSGEEATPAVVVTPEGEVVRILTGEQEHHISADVAYAVWQYWQATADDDFLREAGAEIVLETARFWASRGQVEADGRYHIRRVIGPDEYHEGVDDNAYTNGMAQWNLERGAEAAQIWEALAGALEGSGRAPRPLAGGDPPLAGVGAEHAPQSGSGNRAHRAVPGYFGLEEIDLDAYPGRKCPWTCCWGGSESSARSSQAGRRGAAAVPAVGPLPPPVRDANFRYYEPRTGHGSSLSPAIHALMAARLGDMELAQRFFQQAAEIDLANTMGNAAGGIHIAALAGLWQAAVFGFAGVRWDPNGLALDPHLPGWRRLSFPLQWKGCRLHIQLTAEPATAAVSRREDRRRYASPTARQSHSPRDVGCGRAGRTGGGSVAGGGGMKTVLVPLDGSRHATAALPVSRVLAELEGASLRILHVGQPFLPPREFFDRLGLRRRTSEGSSWTRRPARRRRASCVWRALAKCADRAVHAHPRGEVPEGAWLGCRRSAARRRPGRACPPGAGRPWAVRRIVLPHDGMPTTPLRWTRDGAGAARRRRTGRAHVPADVPTEPDAVTAPQYLDQPQHEWPLWEREFLEQTLGLSKRPPSVRTRPVLRRGAPGAEILRFARECEGDLIVLAWHGSLEPGRARIMRQILREAPCPILALRAEEHAGHGGGTAAPWPASARPQHKRRLLTSPMEDTPHESATSSASRGQRPRRQRQAGHRRNHALISTG